METILIVEDEPAMLRGLKDNLEFAGYKVVTAQDGQAGVQAALEARPDLIVLDIMLPKVNGYEICQILRRQGLEMPIIMLTAKGEESDIVLGLNLGADDYVTKPFSIRELLARVSALLRRTSQKAAKAFRFGPYILDCRACRLKREGIDVDLSPKEFQLLEFFIKKSGAALTRDEILNAVWGYDSPSGPRSVDRFVTTLRNKIEPDPSRPIYIHTVRHIGYRFDPPGGVTAVDPTRR